MCNIIFFAMTVYVGMQTDWVSGPGVLGPVTDWDAAFHQSDSVTHNIQGQICPVATDVDSSAWVKHIIEHSVSSVSISGLIGGILPADFDNDGDKDLVGVRDLDGLLVFYENIGDSFPAISSFAAPSAGGGGADRDCISVNYINDDSLMDVVVSGSSGGIAWYENTGSFSFITHSISASASYGFIETGDIDNNGTVDMITGNVSVSATPVKIWKNDGTGNFTNIQTLSQNAWRIRLADLNGDDYLDLVVGDSEGDRVTINLNDGTGSFAYTTELPVPGNDALWNRDFDNDGDEDITTGGFATGGARLEWWENDGTGINYVPHLVSSGGGLLYGDGGFAEDMDMDGKTDIVSGHGGLFYFKQQTADSFTAHEIDDYEVVLFGGTHWVVPFKRGGCSPAVDILVARDSSFFWYENKMINQFTDSSWLESSVLSSTCDAIWLQFGYDVCCPFDSAISFQFRSGLNLSEITGRAWSTPPVFLPGLEYFTDSVALAPFTTDGDTLFQYRVNFTASGTDAPVTHEVWVEWECGGAGVEEESNGQLPISSEQWSIHPNPATHNAVVEFVVHSWEFVDQEHLALDVYDLTGRVIRNLQITKSPNQQMNEVSWDGRDNEGRKVESGIYFVNLTIGSEFSETKKLLLLK